MKFFKTTIAILLFASFIFSCSTTNAQEKKGRIPFYALPYYNYDPLTITIGKYKKELLTEDTTELIALAKKIKADVNNTDIESLYFLSIRLYDLGRKDDAYYWFLTAQSRARIFIKVLDPKEIGGIGAEAFEWKQLFITIYNLVGPYLNGYGFNDIDKGIAVYEKVKSEMKNIQTFKNVYPNIHFLDDSIFEKEKTNSEKNLAEAIEYFKTHKEEIKKKRIETGVQDKY